MSFTIDEANSNLSATLKENDPESQDQPTELGNQSRHRYDSSIISRRREAKREATITLPVSGSRRFVPPSESDYDDNQSAKTGSPTTTASSGFYSASRPRPEREKVDKKWLDIMADSQHTQNVTAQKLLQKKFNLQQQKMSPALRKVQSDRRQRNPSESRNSNQTENIRVLSRASKPVNEKDALTRSYSESDISRVQPPSDQPTVQKTESVKSVSSNSVGQSGSTSLEMDVTQEKSLADSVPLSVGSSVDINIAQQLERTILANGANSSPGNTTQIRVSCSGSPSGTGPKIEDSSTQGRQQIVINIVTPPAGTFADSNVKYQDRNSVHSNQSNLEQNPTSGRQPPSPSQESTGQNVTTNEDVPLIRPKKRRTWICCFCCTCRCGTSDDES